jgi:hypothetical protein
VSTSIVVLTEQALTAADAARLTGLHEPSTRYRVLVPADTQRSLLADVLDHHEDVDRVQAGMALDASLTELHAVGVVAAGTVVDGDPIAALTQALTTEPADEVIVVTRPHAVEDTFHTDWASRARERLGVPVLHVYTGSSWVG